MCFGERNSIDLLDLGLCAKFYHFITVCLFIQKLYNKNPGVP